MMIGRLSKMDHQGNAGNQYLTFRMGAVEYGIAILKVQEIRNCDDKVTKIIGSPQYVKGVVDLRGMIVPVIDLREKNGLDATVTEETVTIVLALSDRVIGIIVDAVNDVIEVSTDQIKTVPEMESEANYISGIASIDTSEDTERTVMLVDIERFV